MIENTDTGKIHHTNGLGAVVLVDEILDFLYNVSTINYAFLLEIVKYFLKVFPINTCHVCFHHSFETKSVRIMKFGDSRDTHLCKCTVLQNLLRVWDRNIKSSINIEDFLINFLKCQNFKENLGYSIMSLYGILVHNDNEQIQNITAQIFSVPSISKKITESFDLLESFIEGTFKVYKEKIESITHIKLFQLDRLSKIIFTFYYDFVSLVTVDSIKVLRKNTYIIKRFVDFLCLIQNMNVVYRAECFQKDAYEGNYFVIEGYILKLFSLMTTIFDFENKKTVEEILFYILDLILLRKENYAQIKENEFSFHIPLQRAFIIFFNRLCFSRLKERKSNLTVSAYKLLTSYFKKREANLEQNQVYCVNDIAFELLDPTIKFVGWINSISAKFWTYFGENMLYYSQIYYSIKVHEIFYLADYTLIKLFLSFEFGSENNIPEYLMETLDVMNSLETLYQNNKTKLGENGEKLENKLFEGKKENLLMLNLHTLIHLLKNDTYYLDLLFLSNEALSKIKIVDPMLIKVKYLEQNFRKGNYLEIIRSRLLHIIISKENIISNSLTNSEIVKSLPFWIEHNLKDEVSSLLNEICTTTITKNKSYSYRIKKEYYKVLDLYYFIDSKKRNNIEQNFKDIKSVCNINTPYLNTSFFNRYTEFSFMLNMFSTDVVFKTISLLKNFFSKRENNISFGCLKIIDISCNFYNIEKESDFYLLGAKGDSRNGRKKFNSFKRYFEDQFYYKFKEFFNEVARKEDPSLNECLVYLKNKLDKITKNSNIIEIPSIREVTSIQVYRDKNYQRIQNVSLVGQFDTNNLTMVERSSKRKSSNKSTGEFSHNLPFSGKIDKSSEKNYLIGASNNGGKASLEKRAGLPKSLSGSKSNERGQKTASAQEEKINDLEKPGDQSNEDLCCLCNQILETKSFFERPFGVMGHITTSSLTCNNKLQIIKNQCDMYLKEDLKFVSQRSNLSEYSEADRVSKEYSDLKYQTSHEALNDSSEDYYIRSVNEVIDSYYNNLSSLKDMRIFACKHKIHYDCYDQWKLTYIKLLKADQQVNELLVFCPICRAPANLLIPDLEKYFEMYRESYKQRYSYRSSLRGSEISESERERESKEKKERTLYKSCPDKERISETQRKDLYKEKLSDSYNPSRDTVNRDSYRSSYGGRGAESEISSLINGTTFEEYFIFFKKVVKSAETTQDQNLNLNIFSDPEFSSNYIENLTCSNLNKSIEESEAVVNINDCSFHNPKNIKDNYLITNYFEAIFRSYFEQNVLFKDFVSTPSKFLHIFHEMFFSWLDSIDLVDYDVFFSKMEPMKNFILTLRVLIKSETIDGTMFFSPLVENLFYWNTDMISVNNIKETLEGERVSKLIQCTLFYCLVLLNNTEVKYFSILFKHFVPLLLIQAFIKRGFFLRKSFDLSKKEFIALFNEQEFKKFLEKEGEEIKSFLTYHLRRFIVAGFLFNDQNKKIIKIVSDKMDTYDVHKEFKFYMTLLELPDDIQSLRTTSNIDFYPEFWEHRIDTNKLTVFILNDYLEAKLNEFNQKTESGDYEEDDSIASISPSLLMVSLKNSFSFVELPKTLLGLNSKYHIMCRNCKKIPLYSVLCLICDEVCCYTKDCCNNYILGNKKGYEFQVHAKTCGMGLSCFMLTHNGNIIYGIDNHFYDSNDSPYANSYGETLKNKLISTEYVLQESKLEEIAKEFVSLNFLKKIAKENTSLRPGLGTN